MTFGRLGALGAGFGRLGAVGSGIRGPTIQLSSATISDTASIGDVVGTLSVTGGSGSYTYSLTDDAGGLFAIDVAAVEVAAALTAGSDSITVQADNGVDTPISRAFLITVTHEDVVGPNAPVLAMDPSWDTTQASPAFTIDIDDTIAEGDDVRLQIQVAGGDWSSPVSDTTHTITSGEDSANEIDLSLAALGNDDYEARALVNDGTSDSDWSNVVSFTVAAVTLPVNSVAPVISGNTQVGQTLTTTDGTWSNSPTGYAYQWKRDGSAISGATANTYTLVELDAGADITCEVIASNGAGSGAAAASNTLGIDVYLVYLTNIVDSSDQTTYSGGVWNSVNLGTAAANRKIIVAVVARVSTGGGAISGATIAGQALTAQITGNSDTLNNKAVILVADVPTGSTGNLSIPFTVGQQRCGAGVWAMYGAGSSTASDTDKTEAAADGNVTLTVPAGGVAIGASYHQAAGSVTWTGLTGRYDAVIESTVEQCGGDLNSHAGGNINMISDWSAADAFGIHVFASWGP